IGLEELPPKDGGGTLGALLSWWTSGPVQRLASRESVECMVKAHLLKSDLASFTLAALEPGHVESFMDAKRAELAPETVNHLRGYLSRAFNAAGRAGRFRGANPLTDVKKCKVPRRTPDYLRHDEVTPVLAALAERGFDSTPAGWAPLFATAIFAGLRKGEL